MRYRVDNFYFVYLFIYGVGGLVVRGIYICHVRSCF